jgi:dTDP-glucose pyrophosphorylase
MKAVILAAGKGTRMRELTSGVPKPMLKVWGNPILEHIIQGLAAASINEIFIVTGYRAETIETYFGNGEKWGLNLSYGRQPTRDGTGKAPEVAKDFVGASDFLLTYGDILVKPETYQRMVQRFRESDFAGLLTVIRGADVTKGAVVLFDSAFCLTQLVEKPTAAQLADLQQAGCLQPSAPFWYNAGIYIFRPLLFNFTACLQKSPRGEYELTDAICAMRAAGHRLAGLEIEGRWVDVRDPEVLSNLEQEPSA